jgi:glycosyltransferase involved in cell wall biosynthesis
MPVKIYHFHNGSGGGVLSVIRNLLLYRQHSEIENHIIYTINKDISADFQVPGLKGAASEQVFYYSAKWNFYYTVKQLSKLLPDEKAVIVAHDWLELGMVSNLGLKNPVAFFVHGDYEYYYQLSAKHCYSIDVFICVSSSISERLKQLLPFRSTNIQYARFPVPHMPENFYRFKDILQLVFVGRCEKAKGYNLLPEIEKKLQTFNINAGWHIAGEGSDQLNKQIDWPQNANVCFYGKLPQQEVSQLLIRTDLMLLPSLAEGMPVSVIEAMKAGVVPLVNNIPGGIQELVINGQTGYKIEQNLPDSFVEIIKQLNDDRDLLNAISHEASSFANRLFNPLTNTNEIEAILLLSPELNKPKKQSKVYGSRLDQKWIPNVFVTCIRRFFFHRQYDSLL